MTEKGSRRLEAKLHSENSEQWLEVVERIDWDKAWSKESKKNALLEAVSAYFNFQAAPAVENQAELLPVIIGITGHRDIPSQDIPAIRQALRHIFTNLQNACPNTPLILLSPLAEGADRLAAEVFLEMPGTRLIVPLPMEIDKYKESFVEPLDKFNELLSRAEKVFVVPKPEIKASDWHDQVPDFNKSSFCYEAAGAYIVEHCHILVAIWDNVPLKRIGGTSQIVKLQLSGLPKYGRKVQDEVNPPQGGVAAHIWTRREKNPLAKLERPVGSIELLTPPGSTAEESFTAFQMTINHTEMFNFGSKRLRKNEINLNRFCPPDKQRDYLTGAERLAISLGAQASHLARKYSTMMRRGLFFMVILGVATAVSFACYKLLQNWLLAALGGVCIFVLLLIFLVLKLDRWQNKHLSYRGIIELLRIYFFWQVCDINDSTIKEGFSDERIKDSAEVRWLRYAIAYVDLMDVGDETNFSPEQKAFRHSLVLPGWISEQKAYFLKSAAQNEKSYAQGLILFLSCLILGTAMAMICRFLEGIPSIPPGSPRVILFCLITIIMMATAVSLYYQISNQLVSRDHHVFLFILLSLCVLGWVIPGAFFSVPPNTIGKAIIVYGYFLLPVSAIATCYMKLSAFFDNVKRYKSYAILFTNVEELFSNAENEEKKRDLIVFLGKRAISENSSWLRQHIERPIDVPIPRRYF